MPPFRPDPLPLQHWLLSQQPAGLRDTLNRAQLLAEIGRSLHVWSDEPWLAQIQCANFREGTLVMFSSSAAALVPLRHRQKSLLDFVNQRFGLALTQVELKCRPDAASPVSGV